MNLKTLAAAAAVALISASSAWADVYYTANFSGAINPGNANVKAPFSGNGFTQSQAFSGSFVFDSSLIPGPASGFVNVGYSSFPDIGAIPPATAFTINFGPLTFTLADNLNSDLAAGIQYNNGHFNGFEFMTNFAFQGLDYQFRIDGSSVTVVQLINGFPTFNNLINAHINVGDNNVTNIASFTPVSGAVPEPSTWAMMLLGFCGLAFAARRRMKSAVA